MFEVQAKIRRREKLTFIAIPLFSHPGVGEAEHDAAQVECMSTRPIAKASSVIDATRSSQPQEARRVRVLLLLTLTQGQEEGHTNYGRAE